MWKWTLLRYARRCFELLFRRKKKEEAIVQEKVTDGMYATEEERIAKNKEAKLRWEETHKEQRKASRDKRKARKCESREKKKEYNDRWKEKHPEVYRAVQKRWRDSHKEERRAYIRKWKQENREHVNECARLRRAKLKEQKLALNGGKTDEKTSTAER